MTCTDFLARFSEFHDGDLSPEEQAAFDEHLATCTSCRRYRDVVARGAELLRSLPGPTPRDDLRQRLQHSIYHIEEERLRRRSGSSLAGTGAMTLVGAVAILAGILWTPVLFEDAPAVDLPPVVVNAPSASTVSGPEGANPSRGFEPASFLDANLWSQPSTLFFEYSPLQRQRDAGMVRTGLQ